MNRIVSGVLLLIGLALPSFGQQQTTRVPDCVINFSFTAAGSVGGTGANAPFFDNRGTACNNWTLAYQSYGFSAVSIQPDEAPTSTTVESVGTFIVWPAAQVYSGTVPLTVTTVGQVSVFGYHPFIRVTLNSKTGTGRIYGTFTGYRNTTGDATTGGAVPSAGPPSVVTGGWSSLNATAADGATACTNSAQAVKATQGLFGGYYINNPNTTDEWVHVYNVIAASVTVGTTVPQLSFRLPLSQAANLEITQGIQFSTAISIACTSTAGGNGAPATALEADFFYK